MVLIRFIVGEEVLLDWQSGLRLVLVVHSIDLRQQPVLWLVDNLEACSKARACHQALAQGYCQQEVGIIVAVARSSDRVAHVRGLATRFLEQAARGCACSCRTRGCPPSHGTPVLRDAVWVS